MHRIVSIVGILILSSCGAVQSVEKREARLTEGGQAYCDAHRGADASRMESLARSYGLKKAYWDDYCGAMEKGHYSHALGIAQKRGLGQKAVRRAGMADIWKDVENGYIFVAHRTSREIEMSEAERSALGATLFMTLMGKRKCVHALEVATTFGLPVSEVEEALSCIKTAHGAPAALAYACIKQVPDRLVSAYRSDFLADLPKWHASAVRRSDFGDAVRRCTWNRGDLEGLLIFLRQAGDLKLAMSVLSMLKSDLPEREILAIAASLFDQAVQASDLESAKGIHEAFPKAMDAKRQTVLLETYVSGRRCAEALAHAHKMKSDDTVVESVFTAPRCTVSSFEQFEWALSGAPDSEWLRYYRFALKHKRFAFARRLADKAQKARKDDVDTHEELIQAALSDHAHALLLELDPPPEEDAETYKMGIFEDALDRGEEWMAATFAAQHHPNPEAVVERGYLRAMERGEWILAAQIAEKYGDPKKLEARAKLAFETAMLAEKPKDAQFIMRVTRLKDDERLQRAAVMLFKQKSEAERKALREKKRRERKKREASGEWSVTRD